MRKRIIKKNKWSNDEILIKKFYTFVQYQTQLHECIFSGKMFTYPVPHIRFIYESHHGKNSYHFSKKLAQCCTHQFLVFSASLNTFLSIKQYARCSHGLVALVRTPPSPQKKVSSWFLSLRWGGICTQANGLAHCRKYYLVIHYTIIMAVRPCK